jgi:hypothetical protein
MPISEGEWASIQALVERSAAKKGEYFTTGQVIKRNPDKKIVWLAEFGDQAIPLVAFDYEVKYYDTDETGSVVAKRAKISVDTPEIGETVVVAREMGSRRLPRCLGVIKGIDWFELEA